jgi:hypothetical protein
MEALTMEWNSENSREYRVTPEQVKRMNLLPVPGAAHFIHIPDRPMGSGPEVEVIALTMGSGHPVKSRLGAVTLAACMEVA